LFWIVVAVLGTGNMLAACGQKGPLYLPDQPPPEQAAENGDDDRHERR